jgi:hypothetical protein
MTEPLRLWSVTSLTKIGLGTSESLVNWAVGQTAAAAVRSRRTVASMIEEQGESAAIEWLKRVRYQTSGEAKMRGSEIHAAAEQLALGAEPEITPANRPYVDQYRRFLAEHRPRFLMAEAPVYNPTHGYAGTCDGVLELDGRALVFDIKTTPHGPGSDKMRPPYPEAALQVTAYRRAELVGVISEQRYSGGRRYYLFDPDVPHEPMPATEGAVVIVVSPEDYLVVPTRTTDEIFEAFLDVCAAARWQVHTSRDVFGPPITPPRRLEAVG